MDEVSDGQFCSQSRPSERHSSLFYLQIAHQCGKCGQALLGFFHEWIVRVPSVACQNRRNHTADFRTAVRRVDGILEAEIVPTVYISTERVHADHQLVGKFGLPIDGFAFELFAQQIGSQFGRVQGNGHAGGEDWVEEFGGVAQKCEMFAV